MSFVWSQQPALDAGCVSHGCHHCLRGQEDWGDKEGGSAARTFEGVRRCPHFTLKPCSVWKKLGKRFWVLCPAPLTRGVKQTGPAAWKGLLTMGILEKRTKKCFFQGVLPKPWHIQ